MMLDEKITYLETTFGFRIYIPADKDKYIVIGPGGHELWFDATEMHQFAGFADIIVQKTLENLQHEKNNRV